MRLFWIHLTIVLVTVGCSTGKKALEQGNYDQAVYQAVNRLQSNGESKKAKAILKEAYQFALGLHTDNIKRYNLLADPFKWEHIVSEYNAINSLHDRIRRCPACLSMLPNPTFFSTELNQAKQIAAENRYNLGIESMKQKENRTMAIKAHQHFQQAAYYVPRFKDVEKQIQEALYYAMLRVVVEPVPDPSRIFKLKTELFENKVNEQLHRNQISPYVQFFTPDEVNRRDPEWVDHIIQMKFERFTIGNLVSNQYTEDIVRDSVLIENRNGEKVYGTVRAKLTVNERSILGTGTLDLQIIDLNLNKVISQEKLPGEYQWVGRWATYSGDERALNPDQLALTRIVDVDIPLPQRIFDDFTVPIYNQVINKLNAFYRNY